MPLSREVVAARIDVRVAELRMLGALTGVEMGRRRVLPGAHLPVPVAVLPARPRLRRAFLLGFAVGRRRASLVVGNRSMQLTILIAELPRRGGMFRAWLEDGTARGGNEGMRSFT